MVDSSAPLEPAVGIIGGTGLYRFFGDRDDSEEVRVDTPFGSPSAPLRIGQVGDRRVVFLPRHGVHHEYLPHQVPYRANLWALRSMGVRKVFAACAVGGLRLDHGPGTIAVPDQLIDRTTRRDQTFFDRPDRLGADRSPEAPVHAQFADPYCPGLRHALTGGAGVVDGGTLVVIEGPRFSTRAESRSFARDGGTLVNMTGQPEAVLARELAMCYATVCLVTDLDAGVSPGEGVCADDVFAEFGRKLPELVTVLRDAVTRVDPLGDCRCAPDGHLSAELFTAAHTAGVPA
ncbi:S-methyl-5'-thioadenosine phosphorylase [Gordonia sp. CPCC 206044]|uniref:S-methyl-5'-thioadenosine phosphorylase n=1 Tax=Gordonia sp. CPCC 206044 TaxID=3140793 RepID=UPI003AF3B00C